MNSHWTAFGSLFFLLHQDRLLWLLNAPVIGKWFRRILRIGGDSSSVGSLKIDRILPHAIFWWHGNKRLVEFRTHAKFSKRLYYAFAPLWWTLHAWDWAFADRWVPELSFGFNNLTVYPDADPETDTVDGECGQEYATGSGVSWATIIAAAGSYANATGAADSGGGWIAGDNVSNQWKALYRGIYLFNTASLTAGASISSAVLSLYGSTKVDDLSITPSTDIYTSNPASNTDVVAGDFDSLGSVSQTGSPISYSSYSTAGYNDFTFNATGIGNINKTGISKFGSRNANYDVAGTPPAWGSNLSSGCNAFAADQTGTANDPKLVVTYTLSNDISYVDIILSSTDT